MARPTIEQIVVVKMIRETVMEMSEELWEIGDGQSLKARSHLLMAYVVMGAWLEIQGHGERGDPPTPPKEDMPF